MNVMIRSTPASDQMENKYLYAFFFFFYLAVGMADVAQVETINTIPETKLKKYCQLVHFG